MASVLHVVSGDLYAGAERVVEELAIAQQEYLKMSVDVAVLNEGLLFNRLQAAGVRVHLLDETKHGTGSLIAGLRRLVRIARVDVVHTHRFKENILGGLAALGRALSVRTQHGAPEFLRTRGVRDWLIDGLDGFAARRLQGAVVCVTNDLATRMVPIHGAGRLRVVPNGIDSDRLLAASEAPGADLRGADGRLRVGVFARLVAVKRVGLAIDVVRRVRDSAGLPLELHVFGDGPFLGALRSQAADDAGILFHGNTDRAPVFLRRMHALFMTSSHEGLPITVLEAMALSVPVVASHVGGIPEVLGGGACGWLANPDDPDSYAVELAAALADSGERARRVAAALQRVSQEYSARRMAENYCAVYKALRVTQRVVGA